MRWSAVFAVDRSVLWAEPISSDASTQSIRSSAATTELGDKLMLRLAGDPAPDWAVAAAALERARWHAAQRRSSGRHRLGAQAAEQGRAGSPRCHGVAGADRRRRPIRRPGASRHRQAGAERCEIRPAMVFVRCRRRHRCAGRLGPADRQRIDGRRGHRHRHHATSRACRPRAARLRFHQRSGIGQRRRRSRQ